MILQQIKRELKEFRDKKIIIVPGVEFNQKEMINTIVSYYLSYFQSGEYDSEGFKKYFLNIVRMPCRVETKETDFDTKDIRFLTVAGGNPRKTWYIERDFRNWMKKQNFGIFLNRLITELPEFGTVVVKMVDDKPYFIDLRNFVVQQDADYLNQASYIIEIHRYGPIEFKNIAKQRGWKNVQAAIDEYRNNDKDFITVYERYGEVEDNGKYSYKKMLVADAEDRLSDNGETLPAPDIILAEENTSPDKLPYFEFHREKIPGRWLGFGKIEELLDPQIRMNEMANLKVKASYWATLRLFQTRDTNINRNLLTETRNGEILTVESEINPVATEERNLAGYAQEEDRWLQNRDELALTYDIIRGTTTAGTMRLGLARLETAMMRAYYGFLQENIAMQVKRFLRDVILPKFKKQISREHTLTLIGEDLEAYVKLLIDEKTRVRLADFVAKNRTIPTPDDYQIIKDTISQMEKQGKEKIVTLPASFYKDAKYEIDIVITGESVDTRAQAANLQAALQAIVANPAILQNPMTKKIFAKILEDGGIRMEDLEVEATTPTPLQLTEQMKGGGGVSRPNIPQAPVAGKVQQTI